MPTPETNKDNQKRFSARSQEAQQLLAELGIYLQPGSFQDSYRITSRDTHGGSYPYLAGFSSLGKIRKDWIIVKDGVEIGYFVTGLEKDDKTGKTTGEVGMIHLAPTVRQKGLGSLIKLLGSIQLIEAEARQLRSVVGEETGVIENLNKKLGFLPTGETTGFEKHPVWKLEFLNPAVEVERLFAEFRQRIEEIKPENLEFDPAAIDIDNPQRVSITETTVKRLAELGYRFAGDERVLFGYAASPVIIYQENLITLQTRLVLRVQGQQETAESVFKEAIDTVSPTNPLEVYPYPNPKNPTSWEIQSPIIATDEEILSWAKTLAEVGEEFFKRVYQQSR